MTRNTAEGGAPGPFTYGPGDLDAEARESAPVWIRIPHRGQVLLCLLDELPVRFAVHFIGGRPVLCWGQGRCGHCADHVGRKPHYVYRAYDRTRRSMGLIDLPVGAERTIEELRRERGFCRGMVVSLRKEGGVVNGRIICEPLHQILALEDLGQPVDVVEVLCRQYGIEESLFAGRADVSPSLLGRSATPG
jgi:hypothetical protein